MSEQQESITSPKEEGYSVCMVCLESKRLLEVV